MTDPELRWWALRDKGRFLRAISWTDKGSLVESCITWGSLLWDQIWDCHVVADDYDTTFDFVSRNRLLDLVFPADVAPGECHEIEPPSERWRVKG